MAEFPGLGQHCDVDLCNLLVKCDACRGTFCISHFTYESHNCKDSVSKNVQVPVCPLCNQPVPTPKGGNVDAQVNEHITNNCAASKKRVIFKNRCSHPGCRKRELVPFKCNKCAQNFCVSHRLEMDHNCGKKDSRQMSSAGLAALQRSQKGCSQQAKQVAQDEALARALAAGADLNLSPEEYDRRLAEQMQAEEYKWAESFVN